MNLLLKLLNSKEDFHVSAIGLDLPIKLELLVLIVCKDVQDTGQTKVGGSNVPVIQQIPEKEVSGIFQGMYQQ